MFTVPAVRVGVPWQAPCSREPTVWVQYEPASLAAHPYTGRACTPEEVRTQAVHHDLEHHDVP